ncbi:MAG: UDP-glucose 4-epimerase GalE [Flavobacteriaceae bacterium]|nr:UDP-glucose 4-epimerase GalE [Flavobacteriaceae bacterium]
MSKILVTGGTGYIGSHAVVELQARGHEVFIIDNLSNSYESVISAIEIINGTKPHFCLLDICDAENLNVYFKENGPFDAVVHFAAYKAVGESVEHPLKYYRNNVQGMTNLLEAMQQTGSKNLVFSSSCSVYGNATILPVTEQTPLKKAESPYGNTKVICEAIIEDVSKTGILKAISLRYFNPVGAHPSALIGELPIGVPNNLVPVITQTAAGLRNELTVYGNDYTTIDGTCIRDYIHVIDLAKAHVKAVERLLGNKNEDVCEIFNLGSGTGSSVLQAITAFEESTGEKLNWQMGPRRAGDVVQIWSDCEKSNNILGWKTELSIHDAMKTAWEWQKRLIKNK